MSDKDAGRALVAQVQTLLQASPEAATILNLGAFSTFSDLSAALFSGLSQNPAIGQIVANALATSPDLTELLLHDIHETARRNFEPGAEAATLLFARGAQAVMAHRVAHYLWDGGDRATALALKAAMGRVLTTDMHPAAQIGPGLWLDHGLGFVLGETAVIGQDVSIWHNVTLGSTLSDAGPRRHPMIGDGVVIGAGATLLGGITIGAGANIAAGAVVVTDVASATLVAGPKATQKGRARISFAKARDE